MRPTVETTRDPVRPPTQDVIERVRLRYRTRGIPSNIAAPEVLYWLLRYSACTVVGFFVFRLAGLLISTELGSYLLHVILAVGVFTALHGILHWRPWRDIVLFTIGGALLFALIHTVSAAAAGFVSALMLYLVALILLAVLADAIASHYVAYILADPRIEERHQQDGAAIWAGRFESLAGESLRDVAHYRYSWMMLAAVFFLAVLLKLLLPRTPLTGTFIVLFSLCLIVLGALVWATLVKPNPILAFRHTWSALLSWFTYNQDETTAPGVFQSPGGGLAFRRLLSTTTMMMVTAALVSLSSYFPVAMLVTGPEAWQKEATKPLPWSDVPTSNSRDVPPFVLRPYQKRLLEGLPPGEQETKLHSFRERHEAAFQPAALDTYNTEVVSREPEGWLFLAIRSLFGGKATFLAAILTSILASAVIPPLFLVATCTLVCGRQLVFFHMVYGFDHPPSGDERWSLYVDRLIEASRRPPEARPPEADHLWLGTNAESDYPVLLHRPLLREHAWILGDTGSGKTHLAITPLATQLIRYRDASVVVIDLKGDPALFHGARLEAERAGLPFKWFTNHRTDATHAFNPFSQSHLADLTLNQRVQILLQALGLEYGEFYGKGYFSAVNENVLRNLLRTYPDIASFRDLLHYAKSKSLYKATSGTAKEWEEALGLTSVIERLAELPALNVTDEDDLSREVTENAIDMASLFDTPQVAYFYLPSLLEPVTVRGIAKLGLYSLLTAAFLKHNAPSGARRPNNVYVFIDEFQQIVAHNLEIILRQARSMGIGAILANQNLMDLKTPDADLIPTVEGNTTLRQVFSASSLEQRVNLELRSGQTLHHLTQTRVEYSAPYSEHASPGFNVNEQLGPRYGANDIIQMSANRLESIVEVSRDSGLTCFSGFSFKLRSDFHISKREFDRRAQLPWPSNGSTLVSAELTEREDVAPDTTEADAPLFSEQVAKHRKKKTRRTATSRKKKSK